MKNLKTVITFVVLSISFLNFAQKRPEAKKIKITGNIIEKVYIKNTIKTFYKDLIKQKDFVKNQIR